MFRFFQRTCFALSYPHLKSRECCRRNRPFWKLPLNHVLILLFCAGRKGGHKGRARQYTSPEEIDAQLQAEKQKARVCVCSFVCFLSQLLPYPACLFTIQEQWQLSQVLQIIPAMITVWIPNISSWGDSRVSPSLIPEAWEATQGSI